MSDQHPLSGLYIHIPFCKTKCPYCDFYSETSTSLIPEWLQAVKKEALLYRDQFSSFDTLYLGGGTPTVLDEAELTSLIEYLFKTFCFAPDAEITIEANPNDITREKLSVLRALGVNRVSLGVQSFDEQDVAFLRRRHTVEEAAAALALIRASGFTSTGIDLIYGIPGQTDGCLAGNAQTGGLVSAGTYFLLSADRGRGHGVRGDARGGAYAASRRGRE